MKTKYFALLILPSLLLSSCTGLFGPKPVEQEIKAYDLDRMKKNPDGGMQQGYLTTIKARFVENQPYIPYLSLRQYASLYESHLGEGFESKVINQTFSTTWTINKGSDPYFIAVFDYLNDEISVAGSINNAFSESDETRDLKALYYGLNTSDADAVTLSNKNYATHKYGNYGFTSFKSGSDHYFPLGLYDITFSDNSGIYFNYNYKYICSTRDVDTYATFFYKDEDNTEYTFDTQMISKRETEEIPAYLKKHNANMFLYMMDNFYGLKTNKSMKSAASYYKNNGIYNSLFSDDAAIRTWAYSDALSILDDNHTALVSVNKTWATDYRATRRYGDGCKARSELGAELGGYRRESYLAMNAEAKKDVCYSSDGKTALFSFDSFEYGTSEQVFNDDDSIKESAKDHDTFFKLVDAFRQIKSRGGVENVVLDISLNGGGALGIMMKLLALISKDNKGYMALYQDTSTQCSIVYPKIDINADGIYNTQDCFGDDFNIYILTSDYSFSCGNAFPCIAQAKGMAKIIGQKSGGGECAVSIHYLPNSEYVYHSGNLHLGLYEEATNTFKGFESGATPDIPIQFNNRSYMVNNLNSAIANA